MVRNSKLSLLALALYLPLGAIVENQGQFLFSSMGGEVSLKIADLPKQKLHLHEQIKVLENSHLKTGRDGYVYFNTSNNISISLGGNTSFFIEDFKLKASTDTLIKTDYKPLSSSFISNLEGGTLSIKTNKLSPLSTVQVKVPNGLLELSAAECTLSYNHDILRIAVFKGNLSFKFGKDPKTLYLNAPLYYETDAYHIEQGIIEPYAKIENAPKDWAQLNRQIVYENTRTLFSANGDHAHPLAKGKIIIPKQFYKKPFEKPMVFSEID